MAEINSAVGFNNEHNLLIKDVISDPQFKHTDWNKEELKEELQNLRIYIRDHYRREQKSKCAYCKKDVSTISALNCHVEHIAPKSQYEIYMFIPRNLCVACADCNQIKNEKDTIHPLPNGVPRKRYPNSSSAFKIVHPHYDTYEEHIDIFKDRWYIDITDKGHFTIGACKLNQRSAEYGYDEPNELIELAEALTEAKRNKQNALVTIIKKRIRELLDE